MKFISKTPEERQEIARSSNILIMNHAKQDIIELCKEDEYALSYFVQKAMKEIETLQHITNIINNK